MLVIGCLAGLVQPCTARTITQAASGLTVSVSKNRQYAVQSQHPPWTFSGAIKGNVKNINATRGTDALGNYQQINFSWQEENLPMTGWLRLYDDQPVVICSETSTLASDKPPGPFPAFNKVQSKLHLLSYAEKTFAPPRFEATEGSTPWLLFDDQLNSLIISPASHFMVARMMGDGRSLLASGVNTNLTGLPAGFTQQTLMVFGAGINRTWNEWGRAMNGLQGVKRPANDADIVLKYLGCWTDNGAAYYYNYDEDKGYAGTLLALAEHYRTAHIPIRYMQLDSWWYEKSFDGPDGKPGKIKAPKLPPGEWNRYGGLLDYTADKFLFPDGLAAFQKAVGLPLVTHNRWVDWNSPYRARFKISGVAAVDPAWWDEIAGYLQANGVVTYEQDWLDRIYKYSPAFATNLEAGAAFTDDMAAACRAKGLTMQYCMPYPGYFMQGGGYDNLTTTRVSDDRFGPSRYNSFLYTSRLAAAMGIWPWTDVFKSGETNNLLIATLSAGPVGIGDAIGEENTGNLFQSVRSDGVIVKPDSPLLPLDRMYLADAGTNLAPMVAAAYTEDNGLRTAYLFAYNRSKTMAATAELKPAELNMSGTVGVYDYFNESVQRMDAGTNLSIQLPPGAAAYFEVVHTGPSGVAFLGDQGKYVSNGRQRIASLQDTTNLLNVVVNFAANDGPVTLHGVAAQAPTVMLTGGQMLPVHYEQATGHFTVVLAPDSAVLFDHTSADPIRQVSLSIKPL